MGLAISLHKYDMRLLYYTYRNLAFWLLALLAVWGTLFYYAMMDEIMDETDDSLQNYAQQIISRALADPNVLTDRTDVMATYFFHPLSVEEGLSHRDMFYDSFVYVEIEDEDEPVRVLRTSFCMPDGQYYELELMLSTLERDDLIRAMWIYLSVLFVLFLLCSLLGTRLILNGAFRPLSRLVAWLQKLGPDSEPEVLDNPTKIYEFQQLNAAAQNMAWRSRKAYVQQKQFIENASHELQTPLAIARGKIELLAESDTLSEDQMRELDVIYNALGRVVKLNKSLLLLSRIENGQYSESESVSIDALVDESLSDLMEIYEHKGLQLERTRGKRPFMVLCNPILAHILVSNLLKNAMLHNQDGGRLEVVTTPDSLSISNSGSTPLDEAVLFTRFAHSTERKPDSTGLGLSIAYSIAEHSALKLDYKWRNGMHMFVLSRQGKRN